MENFALAKPRRQREATAAAIRVQSAYRARMARRRVAAMRAGGGVLDESKSQKEREEEAELASRFSNPTPAEHAAAVMVQKSYRGKIARRQIMARLDAEATSEAMKELSVLGSLGQKSAGIRPKK